MLGPVGLGNRPAYLGVWECPLSAGFWARDRSSIPRLPHVPFLLVFFLQLKAQPQCPRSKPEATPPAALRPIKLYNSVALRHKSKHFFRSDRLVSRRLAAGRYHSVLLKRRDSACQRMCCFKAFRLCHWYQRAVAVCACFRSLSDAILMCNAQRWTLLNPLLKLAKHLA